MTTPKQLASSLHHYAMRHQELGFEAYELPQVRTFHGVGICMV
jgi:hypothetical protein